MVELGEQDPTSLEYFLKCKVKFFNTTVYDQNRTYDRNLVLLVPEDSTQRTRFLDAWLPENPGEYFELSTIIPEPIDSPSRMSVHRSDKRCEKHYLFVMSKGVEEDIIKRCAEGAILHVRVLPEGQDSVTDHAKDSDGDYDLIPGQTEFGQ